MSHELELVIYFLFELVNNFVFVIYNLGMFLLEELELLDEGVVFLDQI